jgi:hypothetical protein
MKITITDIAQQKVIGIEALKEISVNLLLF